MGEHKVEQHVDEKKAGLHEGTAGRSARSRVHARGRSC
jgi:hypothetical protein